MLLKLFEQFTSISFVHFQTFCVKMHISRDVSISIRVAAPFDVYLQEASPASVPPVTHKNLTVLSSPAITALFTVMRDRTTGSEEFASHADRLMRCVRALGERAHKKAVAHTRSLTSQTAALCTQPRARAHTQYHAYVCVCVCTRHA